jgi:outer membrane protein TolC
VPAPGRSGRSAGIRGWRGAPIGAAGALLAACASYHAAPLPVEPPLAAALPATASPMHPQTVGDLVAIALRNSPDLRAARAWHAVAQGQRQRDSMAPNPQFTGAFLPLLAGVGDTSAWTAALGIDVRALVTLSARREAAAAAADQVDAQILWQEWLTAGQVRLLAVDLMEGVRARALLAQTLQIFADRAQRDQQALGSGDATLAAVAPDRVALQGIQTKLDDLDALQLSRRHQLNALLGLTPDVVVPLADAPEVPDVDPGSLADTTDLGRRRPDLVALRLGYAAQDARVRAAILGQFPALSLGMAGGSDNANVRNAGPQFSIGLPIFDHNQGAIAAEQATRAQLRAEYAARLASAVGQLTALRRETDAQTARLARLRQDQPAADAAAARAEAAINTHDIDRRAYADLVSLRLTKAGEILAVEQSVLEQRVAIATLVGAGLPVIDNLPKEPQS